MAWREDAKITKLATTTLTATTLTATTVTGTTVAATNLTVNSKVTPVTASFTPAAGASNITNVTIQLKNGSGTNLANAAIVDLWLSDAATGLGITGTAASGTPAPTTGTILGIATAKKAWRVVSDAAGKIVLEITDTGKTGFYVAVGANDTIIGISAQLVTANYGA
jgi:hypothetical protein